MKITRQHTLWIVILAIFAGILLFMMRAKVAGAGDTLVDPSDSLSKHSVLTKTGY